MEKFAVDLDAVLDEFEQHEGEAERVAGRPSPADTGFFSPDSEAAPAMPALSPLISPVPALATSHCTRYDLPPSQPVLQLAVASGQSGQPEPDPHLIIAEDTTDPATADVPSVLEAPEAPENPESPVAAGAAEDLEVLTDSQVAALEAMGLADESPVLLTQIAETLPNLELEVALLVPKAGEAPEAANSVLVDGEADVKVGGGKSLLEEMSEAGGGVEAVQAAVWGRGAVLDTPPPPDDYVAVEEVAEYLEQLQQEQENYMDQGEVQQLLANIEREHQEDSLLQRVTQAGGGEGESEEESEAETLPLASPDLEPQLAVGQETGEEDDQITTDLAGLEAELEPQIGREGGAEEVEPPPYSEVDPLPTPARPSSLELGCQSGEGGEVTELGREGVEGAGPSNAGSTPGQQGSGADSLAGLSEEQLLLGRVQPFWVPDSEAAACQICGGRFTLVRRRHHCRACGKVLCGACCSARASLHYLEGREGRVCTPCLSVLTRLAAAEESQQAGQAGGEAARPPNPANPMEYCSTVPVADQVAAAGAVAVPSVLVPVGVLRQGGRDNSGSGAGSGDPKSVMFSDGIRPGGDLTELDGREHRTLGRRSGGRGKGRQRRSRAGGAGPVGASDVCASMLPPAGLPLVSGRGDVEEEEVMVWFSAGTTVNFVINKNLTVVVKQLRYPPGQPQLCWNFASRGLTSVGQDEVVVVLQCEPDEQLPPRDVFDTIQQLYEQAGAGAPAGELGHISVGSNYLGSSAHGGWLLVRPSHQTVSELLLPPAPLLFCLLLMRWEIPWARVFPLRLLLRLGAEFRYYPAPLVSLRNRPAVYGEIGHTIMNVLSDFKNYTYAMPGVRGMVIHMTTGATDICLPKNRYQAVLKALNTSNETVLALGANFSMSADSHLVAIQGADGSYQTQALVTEHSDMYCTASQAINICNKERKLTGASFVVFNGALKSTAGLTAKSSIVEDGLMVQLLPDHMASLRKGLREMENQVIGCGPVGAAQPDEVVRVTWVDEDKAVNIGIRSALDGKAMDGVVSFRIHSGPDMTQDRCLIRWTEVFLLATGGAGAEQDPARAAEGVARAVCVALLPSLPKLKQEQLSPLAVRVSTSPDNTQYEAGAGEAPLPPAYLASLDCELVPLLHSGALQSGLTLELVFHILDH